MADDLYNKAISFYNKGEYEEALDAIRNSSMATSKESLGLIRECEKLILEQHIYLIKEYIEQQDYLNASRKKEEYKTKYGSNPKIENIIIPSSQKEINGENMSSQKVNSHILFNKISFRKAIILTAIIPFVCNITSNYIDSIATLFVSFLFSQIIVSIFLFFVLKHILEFIEKERFIAKILWGGCISLLITRAIIVYDIYKNRTFFINEALCFINEVLYEFILDVSIPKTVVFETIGTVLTLYFFYLIYKYGYNNYRKAISIAIISIIVQTLGNINLFCAHNGYGVILLLISGILWYISLFMLYRKAKKVQ